MAKSKVKSRLKAQKIASEPPAASNGNHKVRDVRKGVIELTARVQRSQDWIVTTLPDGKLGIECPRCGGKAVVNRKKWLFGDTDFLSRGCTYCYRPIFIPKTLLPKTDERRP